ncbi:MAG: galactokinase family protein [Pyrinomonadaceae bacterium]
MHQRQTQFRIAHGSTHDLPDVAAFLQALNELDVHPTVEARTLFGDDAPIFVARAPGRLDVMGGIADYSGSLVLQLPIAEAAIVALQPDGAARTLKIVSLAPEKEAEPTRAVAFEMSLDDLERDGATSTPGRARSFALHPTRQWAAYIAGVFLALMRERGVRFTRGARLLIASGVPEGKGVSSSAALEVAALSAVAAAYDLRIAPREAALLCQRVENEIVGAPCGVMDQMAAACGEPDKLLALLCQPAELQGTVTLPHDLAVWGIDSGVRHSVGAGDYGSVRTGAFMGYRMMAEMAGLAITTRADARVEIADERWQGFLANVAPSEFEQHFSAHLPETLPGGDFLARYAGTTDRVTRVDSGRTYAVLKPTAHAIYEHFRVRLFAELLKGPASARRDAALGELMYQSHTSYGACGLGSAGTDLLVKLVREFKPEAGLYGAKITGGGSGGTVAVLGRRDAQAAIAQVAEQYQQLKHHHPYIFTGSSPGSAAFGFLKLSAAPIEG